jgi:hypothetical protein
MRFPNNSLYWCELIMWFANYVQYLKGHGRLYQEHHLGVQITIVLNNETCMQPKKSTYCFPFPLMIDLKQKYMA